MSEPKAVVPPPSRDLRDGNNPGETTSAQPVQILEETAHVEKRVVETGRVRVHTHTDAVEQLLHESLRSEAVEVTRVPIDRNLAPGESPPKVRTEGDLTIIPVLEEVLFVEKRLVLKEELHIRRHASVEDVSVPVSLRKQRAVIDRVDVKGESEEKD